MSVRASTEEERQAFRRKNHEVLRSKGGEWLIPDDQRHDFKSAASASSQGNTGMRTGGKSTMSNPDQFSSS
jgi:hypothetical protein